MRKNLITFLGLSSYSETTYRWGEREYTTPYFAEAVANWLRPDHVYVLLTPEAETDEKSHWPNLSERLKQSGLEVTAVEIPSGQGTGELWQIFQAIEQQVVKESGELIFDITHGYRSLPILFLLVIAYLRQIRSVELLHILYGAYDARDKEKNITPVYEITPIVSLLDWLAAAKIFMTTGDGRELAGLIRTISNLPQQQEGLAAPFEELSTLLMLNRAPMIPHAARRFAQAVESVAATELPSQAKPLTAILQHISDAYQGISDSDDSVSELKLVAWYYERGHMLQSATLAGEFLVNLVIRATKPDRLSREHARSAVSRTIERFLTGKKPTNEKDKDLEDVRALLEKFASKHHEAYEKYKSAWSELRDIRNDLAHCGYREKVAEPDEISEKLKTHIDNLSEILNAVRSIQV